MKKVFQIIQILHMKILLQTILMSHGALKFSNNIYLSIYIYIYNESIVPAH